MAVKVTVTASDGTSSATHTVTINRAAAEVTLSATPNPVDEGGMATITGEVDVAQAAEFTVTVEVDAGTLSTNADLTFAANATTSTGEVTVTAPANAVVNDPAIVVMVSGESSDASMTVTGAELEVTDDEMVATAPRNLEVELTGTDGEATVSWDGPSQIGSAPITMYTYQATAPGATSVPATPTQVAVGTSDSDGDGRHEVTLPGLELGVEYTFTVHAVSSLGDGEAATTTVEAMPGITMVVDPTTDLTEDGTTTTATVTLTLTATSAKDVTITVSTSDTDIATVANPTVTIPAGSSAVPTTTDAPVVSAVDNDADDGGTQVTFDVSATSDDARDPDDATGITVLDDDDVSEAPRNLTIDAGDTELSVEWQSPQNPGTSAVTHYEIRYALTADIDAATWATVTGGAAARTMTITGLANDSPYTVQVRAVTAAGDGAFASLTGTPTSSE